MEAGAQEQEYGQNPQGRENLLEVAVGVAQEQIQGRVEEGLQSSEIVDAQARRCTRKIEELVDVEVGEEQGR